MNFLNFVLANWDSILAVLGIITVLCIALIKQEKTVIFKILYALVTEAEKNYGTGTGELKLASVLASLYEKLPPTVATIVPAKTLEKWVEEVLEQAKDKWKKNANVATYITPTVDENTNATEEAVKTSK